jgi:hypothetical protein
MRCGKAKCEHDTSSLHTVAILFLRPVPHRSLVNSADISFSRGQVTRPAVPCLHSPCMEYPVWNTLYGIAGVNPFFVLSGFIMVAVAGCNIGPIEFLWRRATRIYPTYWLVSLAALAVAIVATTIVNSSIQVPISLWRSFLLIPDRTLPLLAVGWTLLPSASNSNLPRPGWMG